MQQQNVPTRETASTRPILPRQKAVFEGGWTWVPKVLVFLAPIVVTLAIYLTWRHDRQDVNAPYARLQPAQVVMIHSALDGVFRATEPWPAGRRVSQGEVLGVVESQRHTHKLRETRQVVRRATTELLWLDEELGHTTCPRINRTT